MVFGENTGIFWEDTVVFFGKYSGIWPNTVVFGRKTVVFWSKYVVFGGKYSCIWGKYRVHWPMVSGQSVVRGQRSAVTVIGHCQLLISLKVG